MVRGEGGEEEKFSFGEKPVRLKGRKVEEAEETNKERKGTGRRRRREEERERELGGTGHTWLQMRPQMLRVITDDGKQFVKRAITVPIHNTEEYGDVEAARSRYLWRINILPTDKRKNTWTEKKNRGDLRFLP